MTDLRADVELGTTPVRYPLERVEGKLTYAAMSVSNQEGVPDIPVEAVWDKGGVGGMGETFRVSPDSFGYMYGINTDASKLGVVRFRGTAVTLGSATTNSIDDKPTFPFLATDGTTEFVYFLNNDNAYKFSSDGSAIVNETELQTASVVYGKPTKFKGVWYAPQGASVDAEKLTSIAATTAGADTWTPIASEKHNHFAAAARGAVQVLNFADADKVGVSTDGATFPSAQFECGDSGTDISNLAEMVSGLAVAKKNNLGRLINGIWQQLTRFNEGDADDDYGAGLLVPSGSDAAYYNHGGVLSFFDGTGVDNVSPEVGPLYAKHGTTTTGVVASPPAGFAFKEIAYASDDWIYVIAVRTTGAIGGGNFILALNRALQIWHTFHFASGATIRGLIVDSSKRLWFLDTTNNKAAHIQLGADGGPFDSGSVTRGEANNAYHIFPATDFGYPTVLKQMRSLQAIALGLDATNHLTFYESTDGVSLTGQGVAQTSDGLISTTYSSAESGYVFVFGMLWTIDGTKDPRFTSYIARASLRPDKAIRHEFAIDTRKKYADGSQPEWDGPQALTNLRALERAAPTKFRDPGGAQDDAMVNSVTIRETFVDTARTDYLLDLVVTSWEI